MKAFLGLSVALALCLPGLPSAAWGQGTMPAASSAPATQPAAGGTITVRAVQGTAGGPKVAGDEVVVELFQAGGKVRKIDARLDAEGQAVLADLPLAKPFQPRATVVHAGIPYQAVGKFADASHGRQEILVTVHETTDQAPAWSVRMRHVMVSPSPEGLAVMEVLAVQNPSDHAWLGPPDGGGSRTSIVLDLPPDIHGLRLDGAMDDGTTKVSAGRVASTMPLKPGLSQIRMGYVVPITAGRAKFDIVAPASVDNLMLLPPFSRPKRAEGSRLPRRCVPSRRHSRRRVRRKGGQAPNLPAGRACRFSRPTPGGGA
jgi:hypothetical protein